MKKLTSVTLTLLFWVTIIIYSGCSKDGATGPQGPAGNANVQTVSFSVSSSQWSVNSVFPWEIDASYGTTNFDFNGAVLCYYSLDNNIWQLLPWTTDGNSPYFEMLFTYNQTTGFFNLEWTNVTPSSPSAPNPPAVSYFKIVGVPPAIKASHPNVNYKNYTEVREAFKITN